MQISPLQLEHYFLKDLYFSTTSNLEKPPSASERYDGLDIEAKAKTTKRGSNPRQWRCELTIKARPEKDGNYPYDFAIAYVGFFTILDEVPEQLVEIIAKANAPAVLYSAAREALIILCSRPGFPAVLIPSVTFVEPPKGSPIPKRPAKRKHRVSLKK